MLASAAVFSHPVLLNGMVRNLMRNTIDYTPRGGRVFVACRRHGSQVHLQVRDSGIGIPGEELGKVFSAFHRVDATRSEDLAWAAPLRPFSHLARAAPIFQKMIVLPQPAEAAALTGRHSAGDEIGSTRGFRVDRSAEGTESETDGSTGCRFGLKSASASWRALERRRALACALEVWLRIAHLGPWQNEPAGRLYSRSFSRKQCWSLYVAATSVCWWRLYLISLTKAWIAPAIVEGATTSWLQVYLREFNYLFERTEPA
jgi:hypothetical protein